MAVERVGRSRWTKVPAAAVFVFYAALFLLTFHEADEDVWGRMAVGKLVVDNGRVPAEDVFAYVPTKAPWVDHEWLSGVLFYGVFRGLGGAGLVVLRALVGLAALALAYVLGRRSKGAPASVAIVALSVSILVLQGFNGVVRAQAFSFLFFAFFWMILEKGGKFPWVLVPASALWANLHGGVVTGLLLIGVYAVFHAPRRRRLAILGVGCSMATLVNPYGVHYWRYLAGAITMPRPEIVEWRAITLSGLDDLHLKLSALLVVLVLVSGRSIRPTHVAILLGTLGASLLHVRFAPFLALAIVATLPPVLQAVFEKGEAAFPRRFPRSFAPLAVAVLLEALFAIGLVAAWTERDFELRMTVPADRYPVEAIRRLKTSRASGNLAVFFNWGEYALYHLYPRIQVSIDGRYETVYPEDVVQANWDFTWGSSGGERWLAEYPAALALYPRASGAAEWLQSSPEWALLLENRLFVLYERIP